MEAAVHFKWLLNDVQLITELLTAALHYFYVSVDVWMFVYV